MTILVAPLVVALLGAVLYLALRTAKSPTLQDVRPLALYAWAVGLLAVLLVIGGAAWHP